jgi:hypothetical protein
MGLLLLLLITAAGAGAQNFSAYLPAKAAGKAARLLSSMDAASSDIRARRAEIRDSLLKAESEYCEAYALIVASRDGQGSWARADGEARATDAPQRYAASRERARSAAAALSSESGDEAISELLLSRREDSDSLAELISSAGLSDRAALGLAGFFEKRNKDALRAFPEIFEIGAALKKAGAPGSRLLASSYSRGDGEDQAASLVRAKEKILALAPQAANALSRLESALESYRAWIAATAVAAYPGDIALVPEKARAGLAFGVAEISSLGPAREAKLFGVMASGDARDKLSALSAKRLAEAWELSSASRRRELARLCGLPESTLASFSIALTKEAEPQAAAAGAGTVAPAGSGTKARSVPDLMAAAYALGGLASAFAEEESGGSRSARGAEPALLMLERPDLASIAASEERYAKLFTESSRRIDALYLRAAEDAALALETSPFLAKASTRALGKTPEKVVVRAIDLASGDEVRGRRVAFMATATDSSGGTAFLPIRSTLAAEEYARAFSKAAGLASSKESPAILLDKYGQIVVSAYDPERSGESFVIDIFPKRSRPQAFGGDGLERFLIGGLRP